MFATMRRKRRGAQVKNELGQSVDHFKRAAALAAQETSATVVPRFTAAEDRMQPASRKARHAATTSWDSALAALTPLMTAATDNAKQTGRAGRKALKQQAKAEQKTAKKLQKRADKKLSRKSSGSSKLGKLALFGAVAGAGALYFSRKRRQAQWEEYEPAAPLSSTPRAGGVDDAAFEPLEPSAYTSSANGTVTDTTGPQTLR